MSKITEKNINVHAQKIAELKNQFGKVYKTDETAAFNIIRQMRISHGCAVYDAAKEKEELFKKPVDQITDEEWIKISVNKSLLSLMQKRIETADKMIISKQEPLTITEGQTIAMVQSGGQSDANVPIKITKTNVIAKIKPKSTNTDEISLTDMETEYESANLNTPVLFTEDEKTSRGSNTTEYINNLNTSEANRLVSEYNRPQKGGETGPTNQKVVGIKAPSNQDAAAICRPSNQTAIALDRPSNQDVVSVNQTGGAFDVEKATLINYWADWCPASTRFLPKWEEFKKSANQKFPGLQITELNVQKNSELSKLATDAGVEGYPTLLLRNKGETYSLISGNKSSKDIENFVREKLSNK